VHDTIGGVTASASTERRQGQEQRRRRPRFLARRKTGSLGVTLKISGREIIARV
jgi:hypothetical protein